MNNLQRANLREIESLNQRGGRTLTLVDLIADGTLTAEMGGYLLVKMATGASVLTAAGPSGTCKSTLLANILCLLPPSEEIISVSSAAVIEAGLRERQPQCYLAHEIGSGSWYGYIWGQQVYDYFRLAEAGHRLAACLHADTRAELQGRLHSAAPALAEDMIRAIDLICFMRMEQASGRLRRRVWSIHALCGEKYQLVYSAEPTSQQFTSTDPRATLSGEAESAFPAATELLQELVADDVRELAAFRQRVLAWYNSQERI